MNPSQALASLWQEAALPASALQQIRLTGADPVLPSSFRVGTAAQVSIAAAALAAHEFGCLRGQAPQQISVDMAHAAVECGAWLRLDGRVPEMWDKFAGLYRCADGWVRVHTNFIHHRDGVLQLLGLRAATVERTDVQHALASWRAVDFEDAAAERALAVAAMRSVDAWDAHPQAACVAAAPLLQVERIGDAPPRPWSPLGPLDAALRDVKVLDLTRVLAGPVCGRTLAAYGADVMLVNAPHLPNIESIAETSRGKLSAHVDLRSDAGRAQLEGPLAQAHVFVQGYRPGALQGLGYGAHALARRHPGIVCIDLSAYGDQGPWGQRRGFDSLVQTSTGFNHAEAGAAGVVEPKALPVQILDYASGFLMAFAASVALARQAREGGSWRVRVSLVRTGRWVRQLGRVADGFGAVAPDRTPFVDATDSGFGRLEAVRHCALWSRTPARWTRVSMPPGSHPPIWP